MEIRYNRHSGWWHAIAPECLFIFDNYALEWSDKDEFLTVNRDRFREVAGREKMDDVFERKYTAYYAHIIHGYDRQATVEGIAKTNARLASLGIGGADTGLFPVLQAAAVARVTGEGAGGVADMAKAAAPAMTDDQKNTMLYFVTIGLKDQLDQRQKDDLVALVTNESTKGYIIRSIYPR